MSAHTDRIAELQAEFDSHSFDLQSQIEVNIGQRSELQARIQTLIEEEAAMRISLSAAADRLAGAITELNRLDALEPIPEPTV